MAEKKPWITPYHYCSNNPLNRIDPDGKWDDWVFMQNRNKRSELLTNSKEEYITDLKSSNKDDAIDDVMKNNK